LPLVIAMHGAGGSKEGVNGMTCADGDTQSENCLNRVADREGFLVVYPDGTAGGTLIGRTWNAGGGKGGTRCEAACKAGVDDTKYFLDLVADLGKTVSFDRKRLFLTGFSNGASMNHRLACELAGQVAAIAPVGGANQFASSAPCSPSRPVPVLQIHGRQDPCWPYAGGLGMCVESQEESGTYVSVDESITGMGATPGWVQRNGCATDAAAEALPDLVADDTSAIRRAFRGCRDGADVTLVTIEGGGHTWPGGDQYLPQRRIGKVSRDLSASAMVWAFLKAHPLP
jgi:polyhydroxybutyrate depolymerase